MLRHCDPILFCLISNGARIDAKDKYGLTPLHYAAMKNNINAAQELVSSGADVNVSCKTVLPFV